MSNHTSCVFSSSRVRKLVWLNIAVQLTFPLAITFSPAIAALPGVQRDAGKTAGVSMEEDTAEDLQAQKAAEIATRTGHFFTHNPGGDAASSMARGMASGEASAEVERWLKQFGTARVRLDVDNNFTLKNSQLDLLVPLYDQGDNVFFTQGSVHRTDGRSQVNLGGGLRHFSSTYMVGGNIFGDYDLSRGHARAGAGIEYWRDFLKLGVNSYLRLTDWKDSPDLADYEERPANGWDIRAQGWLPSLPQLGAKLTYEQYYGKEVALFGKDSRQSNPHAITAGVSYTPVPLVTFSAEQRQGSAGENDSRIGMDVSYRLGVPWQQQVDPGSVAAMRSLAGSRYDLVERNNNIVLEYQKKEVIHLVAGKLVTGYAGEQKSLGVSVTSKYGLNRIDWSAPELLAAGGKIIQNGVSGYSVKLPAYRSDVESVNSYPVSGVATDSKGNKSNQTETQVTVLTPDVSVAQSTFTPADSSLPADGSSSVALALTLKDEHGNAIDISPADVQIDTKGVKTARVSEPEGKGPGVFEMLVTAGSSVEVITLTPVVRGVTLSPAQVNISDITPDAAQSAFTATSSSIPADNASQTQLQLELKANSGNALGGQKDKLAFVLQNSGKAKSLPVTLSEITETTTAGTYVATLQGSQAGDYIVNPHFDGSALGELSVKVSLTAGNTTEATSTIATDKISYASGEAMSVTVTLHDAENNPISGQAALLTTEAVTVPNAILSGTWNDNTDGSYTATYIARTTGVGLTANLRLSGWNGNLTSDTYTIIADQTTAQIATGALTVTADNAVANGAATNAVQAIVTDANGNLVSGTTVTFSADNDAVIVPASATTNAEGIATASLTNTTAGVSAVTATTGESSGSVDTHFLAGDPTFGTMKTDKYSYTSGEAISVTVVLYDEAGNRVSGLATFLTSDVVTVPNTALTGRWIDNTDGTYSATYIAQTAGENLLATIHARGWSDVFETQYTITADENSANINESGALTVAPDNQAANGTAADVVNARVTDKNGNPVPDVTVTFATAITGAVVVSPSAQTDASGIATTNVTSTTAGVVAVTAAVGGNTPVSVDAHFEADESTAEIADGALTVTTDNAVANGTATNVVQAIVKDKNGNPVANTDVIFATAVTGAVVISPSVQTDASGIATTNVTSTTAGIVAVTAAVGGNTPVSADAHFKADESTAEIANGALTVTTDNAAPNGTATNAVQAVVTDAYGNPVGNMDVTFAAETAGVTVITASATTNASGIATTKVTSTKAGVFAITAAAGSHTPVSVNINFKDVFIGAVVNGYTFDVSAGFPKTGFTGATFKLAVITSASEYTWSSNRSWVSVDENGNVAFTGEGDSGPVTITAKPDAGGEAITYTFQIRKWFVTNGSTLSPWSKAQDFCNSLQPYAQPTPEDLLTRFGAGWTGNRGVVGSLWNEWGSMSQYGGSGFADHKNSYWTSKPDEINVGLHRAIDLDIGQEIGASDGLSKYTVCRRNL